MNDFKQRLNIPYIKLKFYLTLTEDSILPKDKVSALRGGMGEMLLRQNCINDRNCSTCNYKKPCIVYKTLYTQMKKKPAFMHGDDSVGYLIECENYREYFKAGDHFFFYLVLFGDNIVYFGQYLHVFRQLGMSGIGKTGAKYIISDIKNIKGVSILKENQPIMSNYCPETVYDYVIRRENELNIKGRKNELVFHTPVSLKYCGEYIQEFQAEPVFLAIYRRIMMLDYFVEIYLDVFQMNEYPRIKRQTSILRTVQRFSTTQNRKIFLKGLVGSIVFDDISPEYLPYILAGELLHIGKSSSFGFGRFTYH